MFSHQIVAVQKTYCALSYEFYRLLERQSVCARPALLTLFWDSRDPRALAGTVNLSLGVRNRVLLVRYFASLLNS